MEIQRLVTGAKLGNNDDFAGLVRLYQRRLLASLLVIVNDRATAEDLVQEAFVRAWSNLASLRNAAAFPAWLWSIARNLARSLCRAEANAALDTEGDPKDWADPRSANDEGWHGESSEWAQISARLTAEQRTLVELRHGAGLSLRQIGAVLGIPEQRVKSRLFTLRRKVEKAVSAGALGDPVPFLEEKIMTKIETLRLGAHVFERLSLAAQTEFALAVLSDWPLPESLLEQVGLVDRGAEFLALYGVNLQLGELIGILNHVDRFTECRLVEHLEVVSPSQAETLKQNFFVFEDIILFDPAALRLLFDTADRDLFVMALGGTELKVRRHCLAALDPADRADFEARLGKADGDRKLVRAAQEKIVNDIKDLEQSGRLILRRKGDLPDGELYLTTSAT